VTPECTTVRVVHGDTPTSIVAALGGSVEWKDICAMNGLTDCSVVPVGDELVIPPCEDYPFPQGETAAPSPAPAPASTAVPARPSTPVSPAPTPSPGLPGGTPITTKMPLAPPPSTPSVASGAQCCYHGGCASVGTAMCAAAGSWCAESEERCSSCAGTFCLESSPQRTCVPSNEGTWNDPVVWTPVCEATGSAGSCPAPMCIWASAGLFQVEGGAMTSVRRVSQRQQFLGTALLQASATLGLRSDTSVPKPQGDEL